MNAYSILIDNIDNDNELAIILAIVHERHPSNLHVSLKRLQITKRKQKKIKGQKNTNGLRKKNPPFYARIDGLRMQLGGISLTMARASAAGLVVLGLGLGLGFSESLLLLQA